MRESYDLKKWYGWKNLFGAIIRVRLPWRYVIYDTLGMRAYGVLPVGEREFVLRSLKRAWRDCADCEYGKYGEENGVIELEQCRACFDDPSRPRWKLHTPNAGGQHER